jgi:hypothetical protein
MIELRVSLACTICALVACGKTVRPPQEFDSPDTALTALERVVASKDKQQAAIVLGSEGDFLLESGDPTLDDNRARTFAELFNQGHEWVAKEDGSYTLLMGPRKWPFAVPLVRRGSGWVFDAEAGKEEVLSRRIGEDEFSALDVARTVYMAQREYASRDWDGDGVYRYAECLIGSPGKRDGLYWPANDDSSETSPLGPAVAQAANESYVITPGGKPQPYRGYYHKILYSPREGGAQADALSKPGHYWLVSTPAQWNESGVMTFASNERGWIFEKNLGGDFDYDDIANLRVDDTWTRIE